MSDYNQSIQEAKLSECLYYFLEQGFSCRQIKGLVEEMLAFQAMAMFEGNQSKASARLEMSRGNTQENIIKITGGGCMSYDTHRKQLSQSILDMLEKEQAPKGELLEFVEATMYEAAMKFTKGNQVQAAKVLGVSRGTLRTKLKQYFGTTHVGNIWINSVSHLTSAYSGKSLLISKEEV